jgi:soluble lytic murein transglycosylase
VFVVDTTLDAPRLGTFPAARARERIRLLASMGFDAEARAETVAWATDTSASVHVLIAAAAEAGEQGFARESIALGEAARARAGMLPGVARALFPYSFRDVIEAEAAEHCVDPLLMAAIIRQESRFDPNAVSVANARGLSQVWTPTGREMVQRLRLGSFTAEMLHIPDFNLHLGTRYVQDRTMRDSFPVHALVASYNAGPARVGRWRRWPEYADPDLFVERVAIPETQNYVRIVYASHAWYRVLWPAGPETPPERPQSPLP